MTIIAAGWPCRSSAHSVSTRSGDGSWVLPNIPANQGQEMSPEKRAAASREAAEAQKLLPIS